MKADLIIIGFLIVIVSSIAYLFKSMEDIRHKKIKRKKRRK